ncbi:MAG TPA: DUF3618 domain-containing protein [Acidimicrobiales bacterium]|jgi:hypothetical protein|nr:DUF3618 domain-containing protein [Acidimicrobiales bacterium]
MAEDPSAIREAINETRSDLAGTIDALGQKADLKARGTDKLNEAKEQAKDQAKEVGDRIQQVLPAEARPGLARAIDQAHSTTSRVGTIVRDRPLLVAAVVVVIALVLRPTRLNHRREARG